MKRAATSNAALAKLSGSDDCIFRLIVLLLGATLRELLWNNPWFFAAALSASEPPIRCPVTAYPCEGDLSHLCEDYGCARKGGLSPHSDENL